MSENITLNDYQAALDRVRSWVRKTPLVEAAPWQPVPGIELRLKAECSQVTGSFKARGAFNRVLNLPQAVRNQGLATASGGNFGAAVAWVGQQLELPTDVFVMNTSTELTRQRIESYGAKLTVEGDFWDQSWDAAGARIQETGGALLHPYADRDVVIGQGTMALEILEQWPEVETLVVSIGGGGLIAGVAQAAKLLKPGIRIIGVEAAGCPMMWTCRQQQRIVKLEQVKTIVPILAARSTEAINFALVQEYVDEIVLVPEDQVEASAREVWGATGLAIELGAATAVAAVTRQLFTLKPDEKIAVVLCGSGTNGM
ncbi:MAG: pyridoxal-phosphate dependent enzyme [Pantoea sp.]|uniref:threonine ammonia-lyase n=1 Tax=unclassified Pantoea TaxID=2630326 RepID=UPI00239F10AB|nr:pyridoxal-phosphate dependent enzyme [Pantoea sp.]MDE1189195.1 pyridoxal-phosphate dependent enzyme [Pantoea sp.]